MALPRCSSSSTLSDPDQRINKFIQRKKGWWEFKIFFPRIHGRWISKLFWLHISGGETEASEDKRKKRVKPKRWEGAKTRNRSQIFGSQVISTSAKFSFRLFSLWVLHRLSTTLFENLLTLPEMLKNWVSWKQNCLIYCHLAGMCAALLPSCLTLCDPMDRSPPSSSVHGILQARILEWVAMPSFTRSSQEDRTRVSYLLCTGRRAL